MRCMPQERANARQRSALSKIITSIDEGNSYRKMAQMLANVAVASLARCHVTHEQVGQSAQGERLHVHHFPVSYVNRNIGPKNRRYAGEHVCLLPACVDPI